MVAARKQLIWAILACAVFAVPVGYLIGQSLVDSASSAETTAASADGSAHSVQASGEIAAREAMDEDSRVLSDPKGINLIPDTEMPEDLVEDCRAHLRRGVQNPEQVDQVFTCKALLLADEGKIVPGQYTNDEMEKLVESQEPDVESQR